MNGCTIIATNYVASACVLAASFARHHDGAVCHVLVIDDDDRTLAGLPEELVVVRPTDLDLAPEELARMRGLYDVTELSTAIKPWFLRYMLDRVDDGTGVVYLDPDVWVTSPMVELQAALAEHPIVLTPHLTTALPSDDRRPNELDILIAGTYNLGFVALSASAEADELLTWWMRHLRRDCRMRPELGLFVDQRWIDLVPGFHERTHVLRLPSYNLAYWNLPTRTLAADGPGFSVDGLPLRFFHFSGYDPQSPRELSRHQNRISLATDPVARRLCDDYRRELLAARAAAPDQRPYAYDTLPDGLPLDATMRELYRTAVEEGAADDLFTEHGAAAFLRRLNEPVRPDSALTRYLHALWQRRPDLRAAFPDVLGANGERYLLWAQECAGDETGVGDARLVPLPAPPAAPPGPPAPVPAPAGPPQPFGVNLLGDDEVARRLVAALDEARVPAVPAPSPGPFAINLVCLPAEELPSVLDGAGREHRAGRYTIGFWCSEADVLLDGTPPPYALVDEIWTGSRHVADTLAAASPVPVMHVPVPVAASAAAPADGAAGAPAAFTVACLVDYASGFARANPLAAIEAYATAFAPGDGAVLLVGCAGPEHDPPHHEQVRAAAAARDDIALVEDLAAPGARGRLLASADCHLSLHRSAGRALTVLDAMALGTPVVATGHAGNVARLTAQTGFPVACELVAAGAGQPPGARWAEPDVAHAAQLLRQVREHRERAANVAAHGRHEVLRIHATAAAGEAMRHRLREIEGLMAAAAPSDAERRTPAEALVGAGLAAPGPSRYGPAGALLRRLTARLVRPYTTHQAAVNDALLAALRRAEERSERLERRQIEADADALRELRRLERAVEALRAGTSPGDG